jgi:hypothetical protein
MEVGDLYDLQREGGWEDLEVPQRFYVDVDDRGERKASVMDRWELDARKRGRSKPVKVGRPPVQEVTPVQMAQVGESVLLSSALGIKHGNPPRRCSLE